MRTRYRNKCLWVLPMGMVLLAAGLFLFKRGEAPALLEDPKAAALIVVGALVHFWGCALLAKGKGYSRAILLTGLLGGPLGVVVAAPFNLLLCLLIPFGLLLVLPDKNR